MSTWTLTSPSLTMLVLKFHFHGFSNSEEQKLDFVLKKEYNSYEAESAFFALIRWNMTTTRLIFNVFDFQHFRFSILSIFYIFDFQHSRFSTFSIYKKSKKLEMSTRPLNSPSSTMLFLKVSFSWIFNFQHFQFSTFSNFLIVSIFNFQKI